MGNAPKKHFLTTEPELNSCISATWNTSTKNFQQKQRSGYSKTKVASKSEELHTLIKFSFVYFG